MLLLSIWWVINAVCENTDESLFSFSCNAGFNGDGFIRFREYKTFLIALFMRYIDLVPHNINTVHSEVLRNNHEPCSHKIGLPKSHSRNISTFLLFCHYSDSDTI